MTTRGIALVLLVGLTACSGGGATVSDPKGLATEVGCASTYQPDSTEELGVEQVGTCEVKGRKIRLLTFANDDARDQFVKIAASFGGRYVTGPKYAVEVDGAAVEAEVKSRLG